MARAWLFDLPIELRNLIYNELARAGPISVYEYHPCTVSITSCVEPTLLLVNKQFKLEYEREIFRKARLSVRIVLCDSPSERPAPILPDYLYKNVRQLDLSLLMWRWRPTEGKSNIRSTYFFLHAKCSPGQAHSVKDFGYWACVAFLR